jgi:hypothetical protein
MEIFKLENDTKIICLKAKSFPQGIQEAFDLLSAKLERADERKYFGISHGSKSGEIIYKAAVNELFDGEAEKLNCEAFTIIKGTYLREIIKDWKTKVEKMGEAFRTMIADSRLDYNSPCVEVYEGDDVICMVRIKD